MSDTERTSAVKRIKDKRDFYNHLAAYVLVNAMLVGIWWFSGADHFWPMWVMLPWGVGVLLNAWAVYTEKPITEEQIQREMHRHHR